MDYYDMFDPATGGCLDAPDALPAGSTAQFTVYDDGEGDYAFVLKYESDGVACWRPGSGW